MAQSSALQTKLLDQLMVEFGKVQKLKLDGVAWEQECHRLSRLLACVVTDQAGMISEKTWKAFPAGIFHGYSIRGEPGEGYEVKLEKHYVCAEEAEACAVAEKPAQVIRHCCVCHGEISASDPVHYNQARQGYLCLTCYAKS